MNDTELKKYIMTLPEVELDYPFGPEAMVYKIQGKMFCLLGYAKWNSHENIPKINLKCDPDEALVLRDMYPSILPGYHMNKKHWNTVILDNSVPKIEIIRMVHRSFELVIKGLPKKNRSALETRYGEEVLYQ